MTLRVRSHHCIVVLLLSLFCLPTTAEELSLEQIYQVLDVNPSEAVDEQVGPLLKQYRRAREHKAIALAYDIGGGYSLGMSYEAESELAAGILATQQ